MRAVDWVVALAYLAGVVVAGMWLGRRQAGASDYFLGRHRLPWWAILLSIVAAETSAITVISVPGIGYAGDMTFLQLAFGYLLGRIGIAWLLLPAYAKGELQTAYQLLGGRWGPRARRTSSGVFMLTRAMADSVRIFATAIPLAVITGWSYPVSIVVLGAATLLYTYTGGLRAVVWMDVVQLAVYLAAGAAALGVALHLAPGGLAAAAAAGKLRVVDFGVSLTAPYAFFTALVGGAMLSAASHGTDQLIVQRLLATRSLGEARRALVGSGVVVIAQFALFLLVGAAMWAAFPAARALRSDEVFPRFIVTHLAGGPAGLAVAGLLAAAMSTHASAINSLASATTNDFYAPLAGRAGDDAHLLRVGRLFTLLWGTILVIGALLFRQREAPVVVVALSIASLTYGPLLGAFVLARFRRVGERDVVLALVAASVVMAVVVFAGPLAAWLGRPAMLVGMSRLAWPWYVPLGTTLTVGIGLGASLRPAPQTHGRTGARE
ncbi:MAG TPA: sodium:solute symporter [Gemmatimonadales bacterium]|nr:sodium:solute symporter [Gemmatimonadales bacterium]